MGGITRQGVHKQRRRRVLHSQKHTEFFESADLIRKDHPGAGCRRMALDLRSPGWGRDRVENVLLKGGYRIIYPRKFCKTTYTQKALIFPDKIAGKTVNKINQVVQTDITYLWIDGKFYYLVFFIDVYSRRIVGYSVNRTLHAEGNIKAFKMLLRTRKGCGLRHMIHHSDRGKQHIDKNYMRLLRENGIEMSMCTEAWQNAYTERLNRTIKEEYLDHWDIPDYRSLVQSVARAVTHYNEKRKQDRLGKRTPVEFEKHVEKLDSADQPSVLIYNYLEGIPQTIVDTKRKKEPKKEN